jgi:Tfp pilus assembly protein PilZ
MEDRRSSFRIWADWPVKIITSQDSMEGEVKNVSSTGVFIQCEKPLNTKEKCLLIMELPKSRLAEIDAETVWSTASGSGGENRPRGMGVRFLW